MASGAVHLNLVEVVVWQNLIHALVENTQGLDGGVGRLEDAVGREEQAYN